MKYLVIFLMLFATPLYAGSTQSNVSGSNTAIEGGYTGGATTYESGSTSSSTTNSTSNSNIKSAPPTSSAPGMNSTASCALALSGGIQTFSIGVSGGKSYIDKTCEVINLSKTLNVMGMKVAAISLLCSDQRVWEAMFHAKTYCPVEGKIGEEAYKLIVEKYDYKMPTYVQYVKLEKAKNKIIIKDISKK